MSLESEHEKNIRLTQETMRRQLREMYRRNGTNVPPAGDEEGWRYFREVKKREEEIMEEKEFHDLQEVLDHALKRSHQGFETNITINTPAGFKGAAVIPALEPPPEVKSLPPGGIHLASAKRIGDADRDKVIDQLWEAFAQGYLSNSEVNARVALAMEAEIRENLDLLVRDLEPLTPQKNISVPAPSPPVKKHHWNFGLINPGFSIIAIGIAFNLARTTTDATTHGQGIIAVCSLVFLFFFVQLTRVVIKMIRKS